MGENYIEVKGPRVDEKKDQSGRRLRGSSRSRGGRACVGGPGSLVLSSVSLVPQAVPTPADPRYREEVLDGLSFERGMARKERAPDSRGMSGRATAIVAGIRLVQVGG